jgi:hypothetical protein
VIPTGADARSSAFTDIVGGSTAGGFVREIDPPRADEAVQGTFDIELAGEMEAARGLEMEVLVLGNGHDASLARWALALDAGCPSLVR